MSISRLIKIVISSDQALNFILLNNKTDNVECLRVEKSGI